MMTILNKTALHAMHLAAGARMVPFAGYEMPVQYSGIKAEHLHTRSDAGLFDVSHMGQLLVSGASAARELAYLLPIDLQAMAIGQQCYTFFTLENGGILDDLIIARIDRNSFYLVVNAARKAEDLSHLCRYLSDSVIEPLNEQSLLALQGPMAAKSLLGAFPELDGLVQSLKFMRSTATVLTVAGRSIEVRICRSGYTGEDGFELSIHNDDVPLIAAKLVADDLVRWVGLGARDSLRLEAGLCLYGQDLDTHITPIEARLGWSIGHTRRTAANTAGSFIGAATILAQLDKGVCRLRHGFWVDGKTPVRAGAIIADERGVPCGRVTSGGFAPSLNKPILMAYIDSSHPVKSLAIDKPLYAQVRGKAVPIVPAKMPFVVRDSAS